MRLGIANENGFSFDIALAFHYLCMSVNPIISITKLFLMKLKPLIVLTALAVTFTTHADEAALGLRVSLTDGSEAFYEVAEGLEWHLSGSSLTVTPVGEQSPSTYEIVDVAGIDYALHSFDSVDGIAVPETVIRLTRDGIAIEGARAGSRCLVADISGRVVADRRFDGSTAIGPLSPGNYIVTVNDRETLKITVR